MMVKLRVFLTMLLELKYSLAFHMPDHQQVCLITRRTDAEVITVYFGSFEAEVQEIIWKHIIKK